ncbi:cytochrome c nitrite reductase subunit NrfD [Salmonella enterica]|nr:cytochrome c nitrite reductase subunit NrfD [Salmonella enterica]
MTPASAFHFASLVWDWPIAIYLFLIGISAGLVTLAILLRRFHPEAGGSDSTLLRTTLVLGPGAIIFGLLILVFHLTRPWTFWKLMFHYSFTSVMSMGVMLFQLYMVVLVLWLAKIFEKEVIALQQRWLPRLEIVQKVLALITPFHRALETLMLVLAVLLGAYTGFLLSALKSYPFLNNPILPALFLFSGISSGAAVALIAMALRHRSNPHSTEARFVHRMETPVVWLEIFLLAAFFIGLALGDDGKMRALAAALGGGFLALLLSLGVNVLTPLATWCGMAQHWRGVMRLTTCGAWTAFTLLLLAFAILVSCFLTSDFSVVYVAQHSHSQLSWGLKLAAVWGGHEGSLLLWALLLSGWTSLFAWRSRHESDALFPLILSVLSLIMASLLLFIVLWSDPFLRIFPPAMAGRDLNPMLQHLGLILHPPLLYLGYGGLMTAASVALASLLCGGFNAATAWVCWRWALPGWCALTLGIILGSWWAYCELGWGGWWFWDPVENASLLPWLAASALLHSLYVSRQRGSFRHWSLLLAILTLILSLLGTLIVRSGILLSVHAFALDNVRAVPLFILFAALSLASLALYGWRAREPYPATRLGGGKCETLILTTLLLFSAVLLIVLVGTLYPMIYGLMGWGRLSVGAPYFNRVTLPFGLLMLVVIVLATIRSRKVSVRCQLPALLAHTGVFIFAAGIMVSSGSRHEISLNLSPGQQVVLAGYIFRFERLDLEAKGNYTSEKARITLWRNEKRIGSLQPERRFYAARRQQMMEPGIHWNLLHDWYAVMGEKTGPDRYAMRLYVQTGVRWIWGGGLLMVFGALLSGWRGRKRDA